MKSLRTRVMLSLVLLGSAAYGQTAQVSLNAVGPTTIGPGQTVTVEVFVNGVISPTRLRAYQATLSITPQAGATGSLGLVDPVTPDPNNSSIFVNTARSDWVFAPVSATAFAVADVTTLRVAATLLDGSSAQAVSTPKYCGTFILKPATGTLGNFTLDLKLTDPLNPEARPTFLLDQNGAFINFTNTGFTVTVASLAPNDSCTSPQTITDGQTPFNTANANTDGPALPVTCDEGSGTSFGQDVWFNYTATCNGVLTVSTCGAATFDTRLAIYSNNSPVCSCPADNTNLQACNDNGAGCAAGSSEASLLVNSGGCYRIRLGGVGTQTGSGTLSVTCSPDLCTDAKALTVPSTTVSSTENASVNDNIGPNCGLGTVTAPGVWYSVTGTGRRMTASLCSGTSYNSRLTVYEGSCGALTCVADANNTCGNQEQASWCSTTGRTYLILVHGVTGASGPFTLTMSDVSCNDSNACTTDSCTAGVCVNTNNYDPVVSCCAPSNGGLSTINDNNPCTTDTCNTSTGAVTHTPLPNGPNAACEDGFTCTADSCQSGACLHRDINTIPCSIPANCPNAEACVGGFCQCIGVAMEIKPVAGVSPIAGCYTTGELMTVRVELGPSTAQFVHDEDIVGAQVFLAYDPATLDFVSMRPGAVLGTGSPFSFELGESVNETTGEIGYLVGVALGGQGTRAPATLAVITFRAVNECGAFIRFRPTGPSGQLNLLTTVSGGTVDPDLFDAPTIRVNSVAPALSGCPGDITTPPDLGELTATVNFAVPTALDSCEPGGTLPVTCTPTTGSQFPAGTNTVTCSATDSCGLQTSCGFDVSVQALSLRTDLQLSPTVVSGPFSRCITFDVWDCNAAGGPLQASVDHTINFASGSALGVNVPLPGGQWDCITARDKLHTLRSTSGNLATADNVSYTATFVGARATGGHWLVGGNLNGDAFIDIIDFALFFPRYLSPASPNSPCGAVGPDANLNGDAVVDLLDLVFITGNSLATNEVNCCGQGITAAELSPVLSVTVDELRAMGYEGTEAADLNGDGVVDVDDLRSFLGGDVPPGWGEPEPVPVPQKLSRPHRGPGSRR